MAVDSDGNIYITEGHLLGRIRRVEGATGVITTFAGTYGDCHSQWYSGPGCFGGDGGPAISAFLSRPKGIAVDSEGNVYVADSGNSRIRRIDKLTKIITTVAGRDHGAGESFGGDGGPAVDALIGPTGVYVDGGGNLYISGQQRIRRVDASTGTIETIAGTGIYGFSGDGGP